MALNSLATSSIFRTLPNLEDRFFDDLEIFNDLNDSQFQVLLDEYKIILPNTSFTPFEAEHFKEILNQKLKITMDHSSTIVRVLGFFIAKWNPRTDTADKVIEELEPTKVFLKIKNKSSFKKFLFHFFSLLEENNKLFVMDEYSEDLNTNFIGIRAYIEKRAVFENNFNEKDITIDEYSPKFLGFTEFIRVCICLDKKTESDDEIQFCCKETDLDWMIKKLELIKRDLKFAK